MAKAIILKKKGRKKKKERRRTGPCNKILKLSLSETIKPKFPFFKENKLLVTDFFLTLGRFHTN